MVLAALVVVSMHTHVALVLRVLVRMVLDSGLAEGTCMHVGPTRKIWEGEG